MLEMWVLPDDIGRILGDRENCGGLKRCTIPYETKNALLNSLILKVVAGAEGGI